MICSLERKESDLYVQSILRIDCNKSYRGILGTKSYRGNLGIKKSCRGILVIKRKKIEGAFWGKKCCRGNLKKKNWGSLGK